MENWIEKIDGFISANDISVPLRFLAAKLPQTAELYVIGGAIRNFIIGQIHGASPVTEDIDVVIGSLQADYPLEETLKNEPIKKGDFEGVKWRPKNSVYSFDLCILENFLPIKKFHLAANHENLLKTIDFTVNALVFDIEKKILYEQNAFKAIRETTIGFNSETIYDIAFLAYRLLIIRCKIGFYPSREAFKFLRSAIDLDDFNWIKKTLHANHGKRFSDKVLADFDGICSCNDYEEFKRRQKPPEYLTKMNERDREADNHEGTGPKKNSS